MALTTEALWLIASQAVYNAITKMSFAKNMCSRKMAVVIFRITSIQKRKTPFREE